MKLSNLSTDTLRDFKDEIQSMSIYEIQEKFKNILIGYKIETPEDYKSWATYEIQCELNCRAIRRSMGLSEV